MASSVRPRPNYYDVLGLSPAASQEEIGKAFAKGMGMFSAHRAQAAAQLSIAFETLRNPAKRRAYDEAIGLAREPEPRQWTMALPARTTRGFVASAPGPAEKAASDRLARLQRLAEPQPLAERPPLAPAPQPLPTAAPKVDRKAQMRQAEASLPASEDMPLVEWKRPVLTVGGLLVAAGLIGALAGSSAFDPQQSQQAGGGAMLGRPKAHAAATSTAPVAVAAVQVGQPAYVLAAEPRVRRGHVARHAPPSLDSASDTADLAPSAPAPAAQVADSSPATPPPADSAAPSAAVETVAAAGLPLAAKVMARTIEHIGYACGSVASATAGDGAGVYKVTCTSGDSYRAAPVHGRYRFKRLDRP